jgi:acyl-CoA thioester hydrolase
MPYEFQITRCVEFFETDLAGIMHFSNFFRFMEAAEHAFFRSLGFSVAQSRNGLEVCLPRVHAECDYAAPLRFEDDVLVRLLVERKGRRSLTYQFRFSRLNGSPPLEVARGRLTVAFVKRHADGAFKAVPLPKVIADKIQQAPAGLLSDGLLPKPSSFSERQGSRRRPSRPTLGPPGARDDIASPRGKAGPERRHSAGLDHSNRVSRQDAGAPPPSPIAHSTRPHTTRNFR